MAQRPLTQAAPAKPLLEALHVQQTSRQSENLPQASPTAPLPLSALGQVPLSERAPVEVVPSSLGAEQASARRRNSAPTDGLSPSTPQRCAPLRSGPRGVVRPALFCL